MYPVGQYRLLFIQYLWCLRLQHFHQLHLQTWHNCNKSSIFGVRGTTPPRALVFARSNVLMSRIQGFNLVGHWALDLKTLCALTCSIGLTVIGPDKPWTLGTLPKLKDHNDTIMTWAASVILYWSSANLPRRWIHRCLVLPWEVTLPGRFPEVRSQFQCHSHHTPLPTKHLLNNNNIGPPIPLTTRVIITPH